MADLVLATAPTALIEASLTVATKYRLQLLEANGKTRAVKELETSIEEALSVLKKRGGPGMDPRRGYQAIKGQDRGRFPGYFNPRITKGGRGRTVGWQYVVKLRREEEA